MIAVDWDLAAGSSPHTRGAHPRQGVRPEPQRIIPAYAGSTAKAVWAGVCRADHPRIRGEHRHIRVGGVGGCGSSPHTRGALETGAGSSWDVKDHPRIRGEHYVNSVYPALAAGSSPHTRGALDDVYSIFPVGRIIPAYAGSTISDRGYPSCGGDHPRIRGEHIQDTYPCHVKGRIIPAYAGSTHGGDGAGGLRPDHPRIRGEHGEPLGTFPPQDGSSPHTRGARPPTGSAAVVRGIIPAYAGSTVLTEIATCFLRDHPRIRGEHPFVRSRPRSAGGSSPHTRGARALRATETGPLRIIPAYAGSTRCSGSRARALWDHPRIRGEHDEHRVPARRRWGIIPAYAGST